MRLVTGNTIIIVIIIFNIIIIIIIITIIIIIIILTENYKEDFAYMYMHAMYMHADRHNLCNNGSHIDIKICMSNFPFRFL